MWLASGNLGQVTNLFSKAFFYTLIIEIQKQISSFSNFTEIDSLRSYYNHQV